MNTIYLLGNMNFNIDSYIVFDNSVDVCDFDNIKYIFVESKKPETIIKFIENNFEIISIVEENNFIKYVLNRNIHDIEISDGKNIISYKLTDYLIKKIDYFSFYKTENGLPNLIQITLPTNEFHNAIFTISKYICKNKIIADLFGLPINIRDIIENRPELLDMYINKGDITLKDIINYSKDIKKIIDNLNNTELLLHLYIIIARHLCDNYYLNVQIDNEENRYSHIMYAANILDHCYGYIKQNSILSCLQNYFAATKNYSIVCHYCSTIYDQNHKLLYKIKPRDLILSELFDDEENLYIFVLQPTIEEQDIVFFISENRVGDNIFTVVKLKETGYDILFQDEGDSYFISSLKNKIYFDPFFTDFAYDLDKKKLIKFDFNLKINFYIDETILKHIEKKIM